MLDVRLLVVDDDAALQRALARVLREVGQVDLAGDGETAAVLLSKNEYDVILSDIGLPGMNGIELLRTVRAYDLDVPVILLTGAPELETAIAALEFGAFRYFTKPIDSKTLLAAVRHALGVHRMAKLKRQALELTPGSGRGVGDRAALEVRFGLALQGIYLAYQPIIDWNQRKIGAYEALVRSEEPALARPLDLLDAAERLGRVRELGRAIRASIARDLPRAPSGVDIFVNCHPEDLLDDELFEAEGHLTSFASRIVLELTERASLERIPGVQGRVARLRELGFRIAIDDLGAGYAGLTSFSLLEPEYVKLDRGLVDGIDRHLTKAQVVRAMLELCRTNLGIRVVAEGIERSEERDLLTESGCELLQGWLFAKATRDFAQITI